MAPSQVTNLAFFFPENGFMRLLLATFLLGRSLKRLSLLCGSGMLDPDPLLTTTSSRPPMVSVALEASPGITAGPPQNAALSSASADGPCELLLQKPAQFQPTGSDVGRAACLTKLSRAAAGMPRGVKHRAVCTCPLPPRSWLTRPCAARLSGLWFYSENRNVGW